MFEFMDFDFGFLILVFKTRSTHSMARPHSAQPGCGCHASLRT
jgi:hypothetical protein